MTYHHNDFDQTLTDATHSAPLSPAPPTLAPAVMARIRKLAPARFRIRPLDYALSAFVAGMLGLATLIWQLFTPQQLAHLQLEYLKLSQRIGPTTLALTAVVGVLLVAAALMVAVNVFARARSTTR